MPRLIVLNGPPGIGKSTLAQMYVDAHPLALNLDIDRVRSLLGRWQERQQESGLLAREIAIAMAQAHLGAGRDVVIPQYVARLDFLERLERSARQAGVDFVEVMLLDSRENAVRRFGERSEVSRLPAHGEAHHLVERSGGTARLAQMYDALVQLLASRPDARVIRTVSGQVAEAYRDLATHLE